MDARLCFGAWLAFVSAARARGRWLRDVSAASAAAWRAERQRRAWRALARHAEDAARVREAMDCWAAAAAESAESGA